MSYTLKISSLTFLLGLVVGFVATSTSYINRYKDYGGYFHKYNDTIRFEPQKGDTLSAIVVECFGSNAVASIDTTYVMLPFGCYYDNQIIWLYNPKVIGYTTYKNKSIPVLCN